MRVAGVSEEDTGRGVADDVKDEGKGDADFHVRFGERRRREGQEFHPRRYCAPFGPAKLYAVRSTNRLC